MSKAFSIAVFFFQLALLAVFATITRYGDKAQPPQRQSGDNNELGRYYPMFQDVNVMIVLCIGYLMSFLKRYGYSAVGYSFLLCGLVIQWATILRGLLANGGATVIYLDVQSMVGGVVTAATVLISFGFFLGKISRLQLFTVSILEVVFACVNEMILFHYLKVTDVGGSMFVHIFACYFGLAVAWVNYREELKDNEKAGSVYHSDLFCMVGTVFLWIFWPSFNSVLIGPSSRQQRAVLNTFYCASACVVTVFALSPLLNRERKMQMVHIENATLAGGVAVGTTADLLLEPWGVCLLGSIAGTICVLGITYLSPLLLSKLKIHDTCGVHNLHGLPGILAAIVGAIMALMASQSKYGIDYYVIFPAILEGRSNLKQAGYQLLGLAVSIAISFLSGILTGLIIKIPILGEPLEHQLFDDRDFWELPEEEKPERIRGNDPSSDPNPFAMSNLRKSWAGPERAFARRKARRTHSFST